MSVGSKVVLLVSLGFIGLLIWYYGGSPEPHESSTPAPDAAAAQVASAVTVQTPTARAEPVRPAPRTAPAPPAADPTPEASVTSTPQQSAVTAPVTNELTMGEPLTRRPAPLAFTPRPTAPRVPLSPTPRSTVTKTATKVVKPSETTAKRTHTVQPGDTLSEMAQRYYGSHQRWTLIVSGNPGLDPDRLRVGQTLVIPPHPRRVVSSRTSKPIPKAIPSGARSHTVTDGDSLSSIAERYYGHEKHWSRVFEANSSTLGGDPDRLRIGMVLVVPR